MEQACVSGKHGQHAGRYACYTKLDKHQRIQFPSWRHICTAGIEPDLKPGVGHLLLLLLEALLQVVQVVRVTCGWLMYRSCGASSIHQVYVVHYSMVVMYSPIFDSKCVQIPATLFIATPAWIAHLICLIHQSNCLLS